MGKLGCLMLLLCIFFVSCGAEENQQESVVDESATIVSDYTNTLEGSIGDAKNIVEEINAKTDSIGK